MDSVQQTTAPVGRLCDYYLACLARDVDRDLSEFASNRHGMPNYAELLQLPVLPDVDDQVWSARDVQRIVASFRRERRQLALYVGYPVRVAYIRARSGWEGFLVDPVLAFEFGIDEGSSTPTLVDPRPDVNLKTLQFLTGADSGEVMEESLELQADLGMDSPELGPENLVKSLSGLQKLRPEWHWKEAVDPTKLCSHPSLAKISSEGIYNRAILLISERSRFTRGLESELRELAAKVDAEYHNTALGYWTGKSNPTRPDSVPQHTLLEILPLNIEQRQAVSRALTRPLTVVTGPPGTGKSQVIASIVVNSAWRGEKVLVASKNNKAVDVVESRVNTFGPRPLLLRLGANQYHSRLAQYVSALLSSSSDPADEHTFRQSLAEYYALLDDRERSLSLLDTLVQARNEVDESEQRVEGIRSQLGDSAFRKVRHFELANALELAERARYYALRASYDRQSLFTRMFWFLARRSRLEDAQASALNILHFYQPLELPEPQSAVDDGAFLVDQIEKLIERLELALQAKGYHSLLELLNDHPSTTEITAKIMGNSIQLRGVARKLWDAWLQIQPARVTPVERGTLADFKAMLDLRINADEQGKRIGASAFRRFIELLPKVANLLPIWAITNLSARGRIPFEPGYFDLLVIDEASQCDIASALPLLYRCKRAVIIGDPKQLRHITQLSRRADYALMQQYGVTELGERWSYSSTSLYDLSAGIANREDMITLRDHHRSASSIIEFSNRYFYEGRLRVATNYNDLRFADPNEPSVKWIHVDGKVIRPRNGSAVNEAEAVAVVAALEHLLVDRQFGGTVGVISPFRAQANRIREKVHRNARIMLVAPDRELLIDTVYKFQGDERDVIFFSPVVSEGTPGSTLRFLEHNTNTFNVAVTRARATLIVVGDLVACASSGISHLEAFAQYVAADLGQASPDQLVPMDFGPAYPKVSNPENVSEWERWFYSLMYSKGLRPVPQFVVEHYVLDFAIYCGDRRLAIEIDGEHYHRSWTGELARRDQIRNGRLMELGWDVMRFWVYQIRDDTDRCIAKILEWTNDAEDLSVPADSRGERNESTVDR